MILMVRQEHHLCLTDTLHFLKITPNKTTLSIIIKHGRHRQNIKAVSPKLYEEIAGQTMYLHPDG
jgi:hypothetical protein